MRVLVVEDDPNKLQQLSLFIKERFPSWPITERVSYQSGLRDILKKQHDVVLLDMTMPTYDITTKEEGGSLRIFAGREILRQMARRRVSTPVIVVTQFDSFGEGARRENLAQLKERLAEEYGDIYRGAVYYNAAQADWKANLEKLLRAIDKG